MARSEQLSLLFCMAALLAATQLQGAKPQTIYRGIPSALSNFSCSSKATRALEKTITVSPANICKSFGMGNANVLTCTGEQSWVFRNKNIECWLKPSLNQTTAIASKAFLEQGYASCCSEAAAAPRCLSTEQHCHKLCNSLQLLPEATCTTVITPSQRFASSTFNNWTINEQALFPDMSCKRMFHCAGLDLIDDVTKRVSGECKPHKQAPVASTSATGEAAAAAAAAAALLQHAHPGFVEACSVAVVVHDQPQVQRPPPAAAAGTCWFA
jgi:hypothetical protein